MKLLNKYGNIESSEQAAPLLQFTLADPFETTSYEIQALIDTGYDGNLLIPIEIFRFLKLERFEIRFDEQVYGETYLGEKIPLRSSQALIKIRMEKEVLEMIIIIDVIEDKSECLIGRNFLEDFTLILQGREQSFTLLHDESMTSD